MIKSRGPKGTASVTFTLDPRVGAQSAAVCGEWDGWSRDTNVMRRDADGGFSLTIYLEAGRAYRFRYLLDGARWENDWAADAYVANEFGEDDSIVDVTALAKRAPRATKKTAAAKKPPTKKPESRAATKKTTAPPKKADKRPKE